MDKNNKKICDTCKWARIKRGNDIFCIETYHTKNAEEPACPKWVAKLEEKGDNKC